MGLNGDADGTEAVAATPVCFGKAKYGRLIVLLVQASSYALPIGEILRSYCVILAEVKSGVHNLLICLLFCFLR
jgi:hypothetical protein